MAATAATAADALAVAAATVAAAMMKNRAKGEVRLEVGMTNEGNTSFNKEKKTEKRQPIDRKTLKQKRNKIRERERDSPLG